MNKMELTEIEKKNIIREYIFRNKYDIEKGINAIYEMVKSYEDRLNKKYKTKETEKKYNEKIKKMQHKQKKKSEKYRKNILGKNAEISYLKRKIKKLESEKIDAKDEAELFKYNNKRLKEKIKKLRAERNV